MKPNHHSDPLDQKIDALLASRPLKPSDDFAARVLAQADAEHASTQQAPQHPYSKLIKFALPLAAAVALTFSLLQVKPDAQAINGHASLTTANNSQSTSAAAINAAEAQEIFMLEESLANLATLSTTDFGTQNLLSTLDALYLEI
ncbi:MAG: hypothetical protein CML13_20130 [Puniceicoccaceae bacterium]|nr:hypothetical protein [Puniceicoccaceae bacterium]|tara:strand:+ start:3464 stop:3898 length:435 start_codon:yes stop_codon:yes gene_type:complete